MIPPRTPVAGAVALFFAVALAPVGEAGAETGTETGTVAVSGAGAETGTVAVTGAETGTVAVTESETESQSEYESESESVFDGRGELTLEARGFLDDGREPTQDYNLGLFARLELSHEYRVLSERLRVFGRLDAFDAGRSTFVVEEAWVQLKDGPFRLRVGLDLINWTATEAFHPVDVLNARNLDSDLENFEKLGEPMAELQLSFPTHTTVEVFVMPARLEPRFPSAKLRTSVVPVDVTLGPRVMLGADGAITDDDFGFQGAIRLRQTIGRADLSLHVLEHVDRSQPDFVLQLATLAVRPVYLTTRQVGATYQHAIDALLVKVEAAGRFFALPPEGALAAQGLVPLTDGLRHRDHFAAAIGLEYGIVHEDGPESTLIAEAQVLLGPSDATREQLTPFQQDVLVGWRFTLGDEASTELLFTAIADLSGKPEVLLSASFGRRLGEVWGIDASARVVLAGEPAFDPNLGRARPATGLQALRDADSLRVSLTRYF